MNIKKTTENIIFSSRGILIPFYLILYLALGLYLVMDILWFYCHIKHLEISLEPDKLANLGMLFLVEAMDITMIASLAKMVITGSYNSFVTKEHNSPNDNISSGLLKVKMASSLVGISSIHLLKDFVDIHQITWDTLSKLLAIHLAFIIGVLALAWIYKIYTATEVLEHQMEEKEKLHKNKSDDLH